MGLEPTYNGFAIRSIANSATVPKMARVERFELPTRGVGTRCSDLAELHRQMADSVGFEPTLPIKVNLFSRQGQ